MRPDNLFNLFLLSIPFWITAAIGLYLIKNRRNELCLMAGLLTLKPIITTPIWAKIAFSLEHSGISSGLMALCSILPGAGLTVLIFVIFRSKFYGLRATSARMLIVLDCLRWINSGLLTMISSLLYDSAANCACILAFVGLIFPTAYSVVALTTTLETYEQ